MIRFQGLELKESHLKVLNTLFLYAPVTLTTPEVSFKEGKGQNLFLWLEYGLFIYFTQ